MRRAAQIVVIVATLWLLFHDGARNALAQIPQSASSDATEEHALLLAADSDPGNVKVVGSLGKFYLSKGKWQDSVRWLTKATVLSPGDESIRYNLAVAYMHTGEVESAKKQIQHILVLTDSAKLHNLLGGIEDRRGNLVDAATEYHRAAEIDPTESNIFDLATFLLQHKKYVGYLDDSIKFFRYGVAQYPRSSQMMVGLGVALYAANEYDEAVKVFCAAVDLDPTDIRPIQFLGRATRVSPNLTKEVDRRLQDFAERYPKNAATNYFYALSLWERGGGEEGKGLEKIERLLRNAAVLSPDWYEPHYQLGVLYEAEDRTFDAISEFRNAIKIDWDFFPAHFRLAVLYKRTGQRSQAIAEAETVRRLKEKDNEGEAGHDVTN